MFQNISGETFYRLAEEKDAVIIDVRSMPEVRDGMIPNALVMDIFQPDFPQKIQELDKDKTYLMYCRSGNRSAQACSYMAQLGFTKLYNLAGGMMYWTGPVEVPA
jgi:rhodanese-related sulfurtransferase